MNYICTFKCSSNHTVKGKEPSLTNFNHIFYLTPCMQDIVISPCNNYEECMKYFTSFFCTKSSKSQHTLIFQLVTFNMLNGHMCREATILITTALDSPLSTLKITWTLFLYKNIKCLCRCQVTCLWKYSSRDWVTNHCFVGMLWIFLVHIRMFGQEKP